MKKQYISPTVDELVYVSDTILAGSNPDGNGIIVGGGDERVDSDTDQLSVGRRGTWGNLWK